MKNKKAFLFSMVAIFAALLAVSAAMFVAVRGSGPEEKKVPSGTDSLVSTASTSVSAAGTSTDETMSLTLYVQDKEIAYASDCGATRKVTYEIPKTKAIADASLRILFSDELSKYGAYQSVSIENGVAKVVITNPKVTSSPYLESLSSCEARHLMFILNKTLTQYESIKSVEIWTPAGKPEF